MTSTHWIRCRVFQRHCASRTWWTWICLDHRCGQSLGRPLYGDTSWSIALAAALAHLSWHARIRRIAA